jgi:hypothetical protein
MKTLTFHLLILCLTSSLAFGYRGLALPQATEPEEFSQQVERLIADSIEKGIAVISFESENRSKLIKEDHRDWESTLVKIIGDPDKYGIRSSRTAFGIAVFRETANQPEIVNASLRLFDAFVKRAVAEAEEAASRGEAPHYSITTDLGGFIPSFLRIGDPKILQAVLLYLNSDEERRIGVIHEFTPIYVATALRNYGKSLHLEEAGKLVTLLEEKGRIDIASDIRRTLERIEKDNGNERQRKDVRKNDGSATATDRKAAPEAKLWGRFPSVWFAVAIGTLIILAGGVGWILLRSKADGRE